MTRSSPQAPNRPFAALRVRVLTGVAYGAALLGVVVFAGPLGFALLLSILGVLAVSEFFRLTRRERRPVPEFCGQAAVAACPLAAAADGVFGIVTVLGVLVIAALTWHVAYGNLRTADTAVVVVGATYVGGSLAHLVLVRSLEDGVALVIAVLASVWAGDIAAYFAGSTIGTRRLAPRISPHKTWEGFVAGAAATVGVWVAVPAISGVALDAWWLAIIGACVAVSALIGDLFESRVKREAGVKDSGGLLPGHGGMLDRIDSLIPASIVAYHLLAAGPMS
ncbi:MAG TPA: phosphatidate cytidylyltransferase [Coriobacteriia bacterium]|nr:phosphatidate cytidylyltransferase [Coriobacteriia bacterium]